MRIFRTIVVEGDRRVYRYWWSDLHTGFGYRALANGTAFLGLALIPLGILLWRSPLGPVLFGLGWPLSIAGFVWDRGIRRALGLDDGIVP